MKLRKIQREAFEYCQNVPHPALFCTQRTGKALITLKDVIYNNAFPALIMAPLTTLYGWAEDLQKLGFTEKDYSVIVGTKKQKQKLIKEKRFILTNKEFFVSIPELITIIDFKSVVLDESTSIKNPPKFNKKTKKYSPAITKFYLKHFRNVKRRYILSGTPMDNHELDIYCQLQFLNPNIFKQKSFWEFRAYYFYESWKYTWKLKGNRQAEFYQRLKDNCHFVTLSDVRKSIGKGELKTERIVRTFKLKPKIRKIYDTLKQDFIVTMDQENLFGIQFVLQQLVYLRKICSGFLTLNPETKETKLIDFSKYELLESIINNEIPDYKVIILCNFYDEIYQIEKILQRNARNFRIISGRTKTEDRGKAISDFQSGKIQYILANTKCLEFGATLSSADLTLEFSSVLGNITKNQVEKRGTCIYEDDKIPIMHLVCEDTIENYFYKKIEDQDNRQKFIEGLLNYVKE